MNVKNGAWRELYNNSFRRDSWIADKRRQCPLERSARSLERRGDNACGEGGPFRRRIRRLGGRYNRLRRDKNLRRNPCRKHIQGWRSRKMSIDVAGESIEVADNGRVELNGDNASITMAFNADLATVNSVKTTTESLQEAIGTNFAAMGAYGFDVAMDSEDTVVLSFLIRDSSLKAADFTVYHKSEGGVWTAADDIGNLVYDGEYLSFAVSHFSEYGYAAVPEPSVARRYSGHWRSLLRRPAEENSVFGADNFYGASQFGKLFFYNFTGRFPISNLRFKSV